MLRIVKDAVQWVSSRAGCRVVRLNVLPGSRRMSMLKHHGIRTVVDVGANAGQYGSELREFGFSGRIVSFEPTSQAYSTLAAKARKDRAWTAIKAAIGECEGEVTINVAANGGASSSLLPMLAFHERCAPNACYSATETVALKTLDSALDGVLEPGEQALLKIDTQGYEDMVLKGARSILSHAVILECELSLVRLYEGQLLFEEMLTLLKGSGYTPVQFTPAFTDTGTGHCLQLDGIFVRSPRSDDSALPARERNAICSSGPRFL